MDKSQILFIIIGSNHKRRGGERRYDESKSLTSALPHHRKALIQHRKEAFDLLKSGKPFRNAMPVKDYPLNASLKDGKEFGGTASASYMEAVKRFDGRLFQEISKDENTRLSRFKESTHHFLIATPLYGLVLPEEHLQSHNFHLPDHESISKLWTKNGFLTSLVLAYVEKYKIIRVFDFTASRIYRELLNWSRISKRSNVFHAFGTENAGSDLLPALGRALELRLLSESSEELLKIATNQSLNAEYEDVIFCPDPIPPDGYPKEKNERDEGKKEPDITISNIEGGNQDDSNELSISARNRRILITTGEHHSPFGKIIRSKEDLPILIKPIFSKISQLDDITAIYFGEYISKHKKASPKVVITRCEQNSGHIIGYLIGKFKRATKINLDFNVVVGKEQKVLNEIAGALDDLCKIEILLK